MAFRTLCLLPLALFALLVAADGALAQNCTPIDSLPYTITQPGTYCLTSNQSVSMSRGVAIMVASDDVVLDLGDHVVENTNASTLAAGILMPDDHTNVTIRGGLIRGFDTGIQLGYQTSRQLVIENVRLEKIYRLGIAVHGAFSTVRNNAVADTGRSLAFPYLGVTAILCDGTGLRIMDNEIANIYAQTAPGIGIYVTSAVNGSTDAVVARNRITNHQTRPNSIAVFVDSSSTVLAVGNYICNIELGLDCFTGTQVRYRDNVLLNVGNPAIGATNGGGNN